MSGTSFQDRLQSLLSEAIEEAYARGRADAKREMLALLSNEPTEVTGAIPRLASGEMEAEYNNDRKDADEEAVDFAARPPIERKRAPKGLPRAVVDRALGEAKHGLRPQDIAEFFRDDYERMIAVSTLRGELRKGMSEGRYYEQNGQWFLVKNNEASE